MTEALSEAGGITIGGDTTDIRLVRGPVDKPEVYRASLRAIVDGEGSDTALQPGDVLFVTDHPSEDASEVLRLVTPLFAVGLAALTVFLIASQ